MGMKRTFKTVNYEQALDLTVRLGDCVPPEHLARFVVDSVALLDLSALYAHYGSRGGGPHPPEVLFGLLFYWFSSGGWRIPQDREGPLLGGALPPFLSVGVPPPC